MRVGMAIKLTTLSAFCFAKTLGRISPKIRITTVTRIVAMVDARPTLSLKRFITIRVVQVETAMFARLLPISIAERAMVNFSVMSYAILAVLLPPSAARRRRILFAELKAISDAEKYAEQHIIIKITRYAHHIFAKCSAKVIRLPPLPTCQPYILPAHRRQGYARAPLWACRPRWSSAL